MAVIGALSCCAQIDVRAAKREWSTASKCGAAATMRAGQFTSTPRRKHPTVVSFKVRSFLCEARSQVRDHADQRIHSYSRRVREPMHERTIKSSRGAQSARQAEAHAAKAAAADPVPRLVISIPLCRPHLMLAHACGDDCFTLRLLTKHLHRHAALALDTPASSLLPPSGLTTRGHCLLYVYGLKHACA